MHILVGKRDNPAHYPLPLAKNRLIMRIKRILLGSLLLMIFPGHIFIHYLKKQILIYLRVIFNDFMIIVSSGINKYTHGI